MSVKRWSAVLAAAALVLTGCSALGGGDGEAGDENKEITVVTHDSFSLDKALVQKFTDETGYHVTFSAPGDSGALVNQLILTKDAPLGDAVYGVDNAFAGRALAEGVFADYTSPALPDSARDLAEPALTPVDRGDVCLNIDKQWFATKKLTPPATFDDLVKPEYKDLTVLTNPATSSPGLGFLLATIKVKGQDWPDYWTSLRANGVKVVDSWSTAYSTDFSGSEGKGPRPIVLSYSSSPSAEVDEETGEPRTAALLDTCFRQVEYAGVLEGAKNPEGAQAFIDFLLSDEVQASLPESMYVYPVNDAVELPEAWAQHAPLADQPHNLSVDEINAHRDEWLKEWQAIFG